jgi:hypothetical protein
VLSATVLNGLSHDFLSPLQDASGSNEVDIGGREIVRALVITAMIVVVDEAGDSALKR